MEQELRITVIAKLLQIAEQGSETGDRLALLERQVLFVHGLRGH